MAVISSRVYCCSTCCRTKIKSFPCFLLVVVHLSYKSRLQARKMPVLNIREQNPIQGFLPVFGVSTFKSENCTLSRFGVPTSSSYPPRFSPLLPFETALENLLS